MVGREITLIIGHRGVGKTTFCRGLAQKLGLRVFDLDQEIEKASGRRIDEILAEDEKKFRELEFQTLEKLVSENQGLATVIACGAGIERLPEGAHVLWLRRLIDSRGRSFLSRPRLNADVSPFDEYMERFPLRERRYQTWADEELYLPEGYEFGLEDFILPESSWNLPYDLTVRPENFKNWPSFWRKRKNWNLRCLELRDDLLNPEQIKTVLNSVEPRKILWSRRTKNTLNLFEDRSPELRVDWALELGEPPFPPTIISLHTRGEELKAATQMLERSQGPIKKLAVTINNFAELEFGHQWWRKDPERRAFLPMSSDGRWRWYRSLFGPRMPIHFFREGEGSAPDQPLLWQVVLQPRLQENFAAVLGDPVDHSRSPLEHLAFFKEREMPFVAIPIGEDEWDEAFPVLERLGLTHAAVTAPHKRNAGKKVNLVAANTLLKRSNQWVGANTDAVALEKISADLKDMKSIWLWGAGGIRTSIETAFPGVKVISAREGTNESASPDLLIWATGRHRPFRFPPPAVRPKLVLDLNYTEDSPGLEWAVAHRLPYQSGLTMFKLQAQAQREFWS